MTRYYIADALDKAMTTVAEEEFNRLTRGLTNEQIVEKVLGSLRSLDRLRSGQIPNYDEWDALFYHWYQPSHINLAYNIINLANGLRDQLHIVDFGCGALAMQFGVLLAAANAIERGQPITEIKIDSIDTSQAMVNVGQKIWEQLYREIGGIPDLGYLDRAYEVIQPMPRIGDIERIRFEQFGFARNSSVWVGAMHAVYDDNKKAVQQSLKSLVDRLNPDVFFVSTHISAENLLSEVCSFAVAYDRYGALYRGNVQPSFVDELEAITQWRRKLYSNLLYIIHTLGYPRIWGFLNEPVTWEWASPTVCIYNRR